MTCKLKRFILLIRLHNARANDLAQGVGIRITRLCANQGWLIAVAVDRMCDLG